MPSAISIEHISMHFGDPAQPVKALDNVSLEIRANEFFTLLGPSGCGKTTLLRLIAGFEQPSSGTIRLYGEPMQDLPPFRRPVNTVFQSYALFPHMTVAENIGFGLEMRGTGRSEIEQTVKAMLELVKLPDVGKRRADQLSGGQQQRVALARALAPRPRVLLLDEPLSALDLKLRKEMQIELKQLQHEAGITFIFVTHDQEEALTMSDRIAVMAAGKILQVGAPRDIYERPAERFVADFIGDINLMDGKAEPDGTIRLDCGVALSSADRARPGGKVTVAIRPERASLTSQGNGTLDAELIHSAYLGTAVVHQLKLDDGSHFLIRDTQATRRPPEPGSRIGLVLPSDAIQVFAA